MKKIAYCLNYDYYLSYDSEEREFFTYRVKVTNRDMIERFNGVGWDRV